MQIFSDYSVERVVVTTNGFALYRSVHSDSGKRALLLVPKKDVSRSITGGDSRPVAGERPIEGLLRPIRVKRHRGEPVLIFDDFDGGALSDLISSLHGDYERIAGIAAKIASTLAAMHARRTVHGGLSTSTVLIGRGTYDVKLISAEGITRRPSTEDALTESRIDRDRLAYLAPEETGRMDRIPDQRADLYSLGVIVYELLTGRTPFVSEDPADMVHAHLAVKPVPPHDRDPEVPTALSRIVLKLLQKSPADRYQSAEGVHADLTYCEARLDKPGDMVDFRPGSRERVTSIQLPNKLFGREDAFKLLEQAYRRVGWGLAEVVFVTGAIGIGKSALVNAFSSSMRLRGAIVTSGTFEGGSSGPYSGLVQACKRLIRQVVAQDHAAIDQWKQRLSEALGANRHVIGDLVPEIDRLLAPEFAPRDHRPAATPLRVRHAWRAFLETFATNEKPLILSLEDVHLADAASLDVIRQLSTDPELHHVLILCTMTKREQSAPQADEAVDGSAPPVGPESPIANVPGARTKHIELGPLSAADVTALVASAFETEAEDARPLADILLDRTNGNPLFLVATLRRLFDERLIHFDTEKGGWVWDVSEVERLDVTENVVESLVRASSSLPRETRDILKTASCVGPEFDADLVARAAGVDQRDVIRTLEPAVEGRFVSRTDSGSEGTLRTARYRFTHERIRLAVNRELSDHVTQRTHLQLARVLTARSQTDAANENVFQICDHLRRSGSLLYSQTDRGELARLFLAAGEKAKAAAAYAPALTNLRTGIDLLGADAWSEHFELAFALYLACAECAYQTGDAPRAEAMAKTILERSSRKENRLQVYLLMINLHTGLGRFEMSIQAGREAAELLGFRIPKSSLGLSTFVELVRAQLLWRTRDVMNLPAMTDPDHLANMDLLMELTAAAFLHDEDLAVWIALRLFNLTLEHGLSEYSPFGIMIFGVLMVNFGALDRAYELGEQALALHDQLVKESYSYKLHFLHDSLIRHWTKGLHAEPNLLEAAVESAKELGDSNFVEFALVGLVEHAFYAGDSLAEIRERCERYARYFSQVRGSDLSGSVQGQQVLLYSQLVKSLIGETDERASLSDSSFEETEYVTSLDKGAARLVYHTGKALLHYLYGDPEEAVRQAKEAKGLLSLAVASIYVREVRLIYALCLAGAYENSGFGTRIICLVRLFRIKQKLRKWTRACPGNIEHGFLLISAEIARMAGFSGRAETLYDRAIESAERFGRSHIGAIAAERAANHYLQHDRNIMARRYLRDAQRLFDRWGAYGKVTEIGERYSELLVGDRDRPAAGASREPGHDTLDLAALIEASQLLSSEMMLGPLLASLMDILLKNAGADRGFIILRKDGELFVEAQLEFSENQSARRLRTPLDERPDLAHSVVKYVVQMQEAALVHDALHDSLFRHDPYVVAAKPKSILCVPLIHQSHLEGVLYLENSLTGDAFTAQQLELLQVLSTQAAISIANARLYGDLSEAHEKLAEHAQKLEKRVRERTAELQRQKELAEAGRETIGMQAAKLREMDELKSRFFANISHEFRTPLTLIVGPLTDLLESSDEEVQTVARARIASMHRNAQRLLRLINQLLDLSKLEAGSLALNARAADIVPFTADVVESFTGHAEREGIELSFKARAKPGAVYFDPEHLEKVLINLLANAVKFTPPGGKVHVSVDVAGDDEARVVEIRVKDTGRGIPEDELPHIFDRFRQVDRGPTTDAGGTGIGLSLARELVQLHHGQITVESELGFGSSFTVALPLGRAHLTEDQLSFAGVDDEFAAATTAVISEVEATAAAAASQSTHSTAQSGDGDQILVVDDNADMRQYLTSCLEQRYTVVEAEDGQIGLEKAREIVPDLVIADVMMPRLDGYALSREIKEDEVLNHIPVILLTAKAGEESKIEGLRTGADDYLFKPFSSKELLARIENLIEQRRKLRRRFSTEMRIEPSDIAATSMDAAFLQRAQEVVEEHVGEQTFNVDAFADEMHMSVRQLQRKLRALTDETPNSFIRIIRLKRAAQLLEQHAGTVSEIAFEVGFSYQSHFSNAFREFFGKSPTEYAGEHDAAS